MLFTKFMLLMNRIILLILIFAIGNSSYSQRTVGLISYKPWKVFEGYNLIYPHNQSDVFLLNNCGEIVHKWEGEDDTRPGNTAYILENGNLVKTSRSSNIMGDPIWAGGGGATVEIRYGKMSFYGRIPSIMILLVYITI